MTAPALPGFSPEISPALAEVSGLSETAMDLVAASESVADSLATLASNELFLDSVAALSSGLTKEAAVAWAVEAAKVVADKLPAEELEALASAEEWLASGGAALDQVTAALADNPMQGPGAWSALAADWAGKASEMALEEAPPVAKAVESAVKLSAALNEGDWPLFDSGQAADAVAGLADGLEGQVPEIGDLASAAMDVAAPVMDAAADETVTPEQTLNDLLKPFVELGMKIAAEPPAFAPPSAPSV